MFNIIALLSQMLSSPACAEGDKDKFPDINMLLDMITKACTAELAVLGVSAHMHYVCTLVDMTSNHGIAESAPECANSLK